MQVILDVINIITKDPNKGPKVFLGIIAGIAAVLILALVFDLDPWPSSISPAVPAVPVEEIGK